MIKLPTFSAELACRSKVLPSLHISALERAICPHFLEGLREWPAPLDPVDQPLTAPMVKPAMNRSRNRLKTNAIGNATRTVAA